MTTRKIGGITFNLFEGLPFKTWRIGRRASAPRYFTAHYNGPHVPAFGYVPGEKSQIISDARWHMRAGAFGVASGADGIQYHGGTLSDGSNWLFRDINDILWHCGNYEGNNWSIAWHMPLGGMQQMTNAQRIGLSNAIGAFRREFGIHASNVRGHLEWKPTACPGTIMTYVRVWRSYALANSPTMYFKTKVNANCRTSPEVKLDGSNIVHIDGKPLVTPANTIVPIGALIEDGIPYQNDPTYVWRSDGIGFYHYSVGMVGLYGNLLQ